MGSDCISSCPLLIFLIFILTILGELQDDFCKTYLTDFSPQLNTLQEF